MWCNCLQRTFQTSAPSLTVIRRQGTEKLLTNIWVESRNKTSPLPIASPIAFKRPDQWVETRLMKIFGGKTKKDQESCCLWSEKDLGWWKVNKLLQKITWELHFLCGELYMRVEAREAAGGRECVLLNVLLLSEVPTYGGWCLFLIC